jgi:hypothetical protein
MSIQVVTVCDKEPTHDYLIRGWRGLNESLHRFGHKPLVLGYGQKWTGLGSKPKLLKKAIESGLVTADRILVVDSHDVVFSDSPENIDHLFLTTYEALFDIVWNAERWIFPDVDLGPHHPASDYPYRYLNSGASIGSTDSFLAMLKQMDVDSWPDDFKKPDGTWSHLNDQLEVQKKFLFGQVADDEPKMALDDCCLIFQTFVGEDPENFNLSKPGVVANKITGTTPSVLHGNGPSKQSPAWEAVLNHLRL